MDANIYHEQSHKPISHYECVVKSNRIHQEDQTKLRALDAMNQLDGWCSQEKAEVLMELIFMTRPSTIVEIGVWGGKSVVPMAFALRHNGKGKIYGIDPWSSVCSVEGMDEANKEWWGHVNHDNILKGLQNKISEFGLENEIVLIRATSEDAPPIDNIDILHIDGNHSDKTSFIDVTKWVPLVKKGGIIIFDDVTWTINGQFSNVRAVKWLDENCTRFAEFKDDCDWVIWIKP